MSKWISEASSDQHPQQQLSLGEGFESPVFSHSFRDTTLKIEQFEAAKIDRLEPGCERQPRPFLVLSG